MCIICLSLNKEVITVDQANDLYEELKEDIVPSHAKEVEDLLWSKWSPRKRPTTDFKGFSDDDDDYAWLFGTED